jgi:hypothetical protein
VEVPVQTQRSLPDTLEGLRALERRVEREWWWLNGALHAAAQVYAERPYGDARCLREMQAQARDVDRWRVEIAMRIAEMDTQRDKRCANAQTFNQDP